MRRRAAIIIFDNGHVALIKRVRNDKTYYVFPGGGIEADETPVHAAKREALEELGLEVEIGPCMFELIGASQEYYYLARVKSGIFGAGTGEEFTNPATERRSYEAVWMPFDLLHTIDLYPEEIDVEYLIEIGSVDFFGKGIPKKRMIKI